MIVINFHTCLKLTLFSDIFYIIGLIGMFTGSFIALVRIHKVKKKAIVVRNSIKRKLSRNTIVASVILPGMVVVPTQTT